MAAERIPASDVPDVLFEQLDYLLQYHSVWHTDVLCRDCQRMAMIRVALLRPFEPVMRASAARA